MNANSNKSKSSFFFKDQKKEFLDWLESLKISKYWLDTMNQPDSLALCKEINQVLQHFREITLPEKEKLSALFEIDSCLQGVYAKLHEGHLNAKLPLIHEKQQCVDLIIHSYMGLVKAYYEVMLDDKAKNSQISDHYLALTSCKAFQGLGIVFLTMSEVYTHPPKGFWLLCYSLFSISEKYMLLDSKVIIENAIYSTAGLFKRLMVFYIIDKEKCSSEEIGKIFHALVRGINHIQSYIQETTDSANSSSSKTYGFSLNKDEPPSIQNNIPPATAKLLRYIEKQEVINIIQFLVHEKKLHPQINSASSETLNGMLVSLEPQKYKRQTRINKKYQCRTIIGLDNLIDFLLEKEEKKHVVIDKNVSEYDDDFDNFHLSLDWSSDKKTGEDNHISDNFEIIDSSMNGYGILWNNPAAGKLQIGDAIGIIPDFSTTIKKIEIGLIRRVYIADENIRLGVELIGFESTLINIARHNAETGDWVLFLFGTPNYDIGILCHKELHYQTGEAVFVQLADKKVPCNFGAILNSTPLLDHIALSY